MEDLQAAVKTCFNKYADFNGRAARPEFWWFVVFWIVVLAVTSLVSRYVYALAALAMLLPMIAAGARRLHDTGKSGWLQLLNFIPLIGGLILVYLMAQPSQPGPNEYGEPVTPMPSTGLAPGQQ